MTERIQRRRARGWRMPAGAVTVDRSTPWGNPFVVGVTGPQADCVRLHGLLVLQGAVCITCRGAKVGDLIDHMRWVRSHVHLLRDKVLACWCSEDQPCHADNLIRLSEDVEADRRRTALDSQRRYRHQRAMAAL